MNKKIALIVVLLALASTACATLKTQPSAVGNSTATFTSMPTNTLAPTNTPEPTVTDMPAPTTTPRQNREGGKKAGREETASATPESQELYGWEIEYYFGATDLMRSFVFVRPDRNWAKFPNEDWAPGNFEAKNGLEYGQELSSYCQQSETCDIVIAARSYRSITGDYSIEGIGECKEDGSGVGCAVIIFNVGDVTASFEDQHVDTGHTITGLYWNGDENDQAITALASHLSYRMIGPVGGMPANPGANCSRPSGCAGADIVFAITSGNEILVRGHTVVR